MYYAPEPARSRYQHAFRLTSLKLVKPFGETLTLPPTTNTVSSATRYSGTYTEGSGGKARTMERSGRDVEELLLFHPLDELGFIRNFVVELAHERRFEGELL